MTVPPFGIYPPLVCFFNDDESINYTAIAQHVERQINSGVTGLVIHGSNGEAAHLLHDERSEIIRLARRIIDKSSNINNKSATIIAGCSAPSIRETLQLITEAKKAGANYALVLPPSYYSSAMTKPVIKSYFTTVAAKSPLPIVLYNFPVVTSGIDLDSDLIADVAKTSPNVVGVKLSCGSVGKVQRLSSSFDPERFVPFGGKADFLLPGLVAGSNGAVPVLANLVPRAHLEVTRLWRAGKLREAQSIQAKLSHADWTLGKLGISGTKVAIQKYFGYGSAQVRGPIVTGNVSVLDADTEAKLLAVVEMEKKLAQQDRSSSL